MALFSPSSLPPFEWLEVVELGGAMGNELRAIMSGETQAKRARVTGPKAQRIGELFRTLPPGEQARCHIPPFGLVFHRGSEMVGRASICWKCNNIHGDMGADQLVYQFDSTAKIARELLAACKKAIAVAP